MHSANFLHFIQFRFEAIKWYYQQQNGLPTAVNAIKIIPHKHAERPISRVILDSVELTVLTIIDCIAQKSL